MGESQSGVLRFGEGERSHRLPLSSRRSELYCSGYRVRLQTVDARHRARVRDRMRLEIGAEAVLAALPADSATGPDHLP
eukprot:883016-Alexandrium_andersonii.AAC.1